MCSSLESLPTLPISSVHGFRGPKLTYEFFIDVNNKNSFTSNITETKFVVSSIFPERVPTQNGVSVVAGPYVSLPDCKCRTVS